jgi:hypothetical protein
VSRSGEGGVRRSCVTRLLEPWCCGDVWEGRARGL